MIRNNIKLGLIAVIAVAALGMAGCGGSSGGDYTADSAYEGASGEGFDYGYDDYEEVPTEEASEAEDASGETKVADNSANADSGSGTGSSKKINDEKLIYSCDLTVDTLDYAESVKSFRKLIDKYDGFVQSENESDDGGYDDYYVTESRVDLRHTYTATVRIPSADYDAFLEEAGSIGDVRSKDAHVENISQNYYNLAAELEVLQTKYERYLDMLSKATTTKDILDIENSITSIETQINQIKTQLNRYDNDVAYSYVNITIRQVKEYVDDETDRTTIPGAISDSWKQFREVAHGLFIALIYLFPYLLIIAIIVVVILIITRVVSKKKKIKQSAVNINNNIKPTGIQDAAGINTNQKDENQ